MWFSSKKNIVKEGLFEGYVDIHSHILFGVDDGAKDQHSTERILSAMQALGVKRIFATPHVMSHLHENSAESLTEAFHNRLEPLSDRFNIEFGLAAEYMIDRGFMDMMQNGDKLLTFSNNRLLVEFSASGHPVDIGSVFFEIEDCGYSAILAHPERYPYFTEKIIRQLKSKDVAMQLNLLSLGGYYGTTVAKNALSILNKGYYDFVGSDTHSKHMVDKIKDISLGKRDIESLKRLIANNNTFFK